MLSQKQFVKVLHGDTKAVDTSNGNVVLDIRPLVLKLGDRFGFVTNLADQIPPDAGQVTILEADNLDTAQKITHWLEQIANFVWIFALAAWVAAIWLARGRRRQEVRSLGIGLVAVGLIVLVVRWLAGKYVVDQLVATDSMRPAVHNAWQIITQSLAAAGWVALVVGILVAIGAWLVGPGDRATAARACARSAPAAAGGRLGRVRRRDAAASSGSCRSRSSARRRCSSSRLRSASSSSCASSRRSRLLRRPAPPRATRSATGGRLRLSRSAQAAGRQSSHCPWSTTSWARMP